MSFTRGDEVHSRSEHSPHAIDPVVSGHAHTDPLDCFNEDLVWIIDKLASRTAGIMGIVSRHIVADNTAVVLARTTEAPEEEDRVCSALVKSAAGQVAAGSPIDEDVSNLIQRPLSAGNSGAEYWALHLCFAPTPSVKLVASVCRNAADGRFGPIEEMTARTLYPVLSRYVRLWWLHRSERRRANSLSAALDLSDVGVVMLDQTARMLFANNRARAIFEQPDGLCVRDGAMSASKSGDGIRLQAAIQHAIQSNRDPEAVEEGQKASPVLCVRRGARRALIVTVVSVERCAVDLHDPAVIVYALDPDQDVEQLLLPACELYQLTPAESRLVRHLVRGSRLAEAAERMRIRPDTARDYLKQVFVKTMTHRQADLIRVMLASMMRANVRVDPALI